ncbi:MAG: hypothetical protein K8H90_05150 [Thermoanaerobaculia bacterium]|nr:hypothetical protein [Thermoanaerobaculia bacterium]
MWRLDRATSPTDAPAVSADEIELYRTLPRLDELCASCDRPEAARRALDFMTVTSSALTLEVGSGTSLFGIAAQVRVEGGLFDVSMPASLVPEIIEAVSAGLAEQAIAIDATTGQRFHEIAAAQLEHALIRLGFPLQRLIDEKGVPARWVVRVADQSQVAVELLSSLSDGGLGDLLEQNFEDISATEAGEGGAFDTSARGRKGLRDARLIVVAVPRHVAIQGTGAVMPLEDLDWVTRRLAEEDPDAFFSFCEDLARPAADRMLAFETINVFEHWWENGQSIHRAGTSISGLLLEPHRGTEEWHRASRELGIERALLALRLPRLDQWTRQVRNGEGLELFDVRRGRYALVTCRASPTAILAVFREFSPELAPRLEFIARGLSWKLEQLGEGDQLTFPLRIILRELGTPEQQPIRYVDARSAGELVEIAIGISPMALALLEAAADRFEHLLGEALGQGVQAVRADWPVANFLDAWAAAPPGIRVDGFHPPCAVQHEAPPQRPGVAARSRWLKLLGERLAAAGQVKGRLVGDEARRFETQEVFPTFRQLLHATMARYSTPGLLERALAELDRAHGYRFHEERVLSFRQRFPVTSVDAVRETGRIMEEMNHVTRAIEIVVEELIQRPSRGRSEPDRLEWRELLAIASLMLDSGLRSEQANLRLQPVAIEINDLYEVFLRWDGGEVDIDLEAMNQAMARQARIGPDRESDEPGETKASRSLAEGLPQFRELDTAMLAGLAFSLETLLRLVGALESWPVTPERPVAWVAVPDIVRFCKEEQIDVPEVEVAAAIRYLTFHRDLLGDGVLEHWEQERRSVRVANRPLVQDPTGKLSIAPWAMYGFRRRLVRYLQGGRLIWPDRDLPHGVRRALSSYRSKRNLELEREVLQVARTAGLRAWERLKKPKTIGLKALPGEIDVLAIDEARGLIWVIEAKDPFEAFSSAQIRSLSDDFHDDSGDHRYVSKLIAKAEAIRGGIPLVTEKLAVSSAARWEVRSLIVTRYVVAAAFVRRPRVTFTTLEGLAEVLSG